MKFSFGCAHVWRQRALAAHAHAQAHAHTHAQADARPGGGAWDASVRARAVSQRARPLVPHDAALRLVTASTDYSTGWVGERVACDLRCAYLIKNTISVNVYLILFICSKRGPQIFSLFILKE